MSNSNAWIGVDLDGTLAYYDHWRGIKHVGAPIEPMCNRVRFWLSQEKNIRIMTARVTPAEQMPEMSGIIRPLAETLAPIHAFCLEQFGVILPVTNIKDFNMIELWDARAVQVEMNTGLIVG